MEMTTTFTRSWNQFKALRSSLCQTNPVWPFYHTVNAYAQHVMRTRTFCGKCMVTFPYPFHFLNKTLNILFGSIECFDGHLTGHIDSTIRGFIMDMHNAPKKELLSWLQPKN